MSTQTIKARALLSELESMWPGLRDIWPMDSEFWCPTFGKLITALNEITTLRRIAFDALSSKGFHISTKFYEGGHDCDNFALDLHSDISRRLRVNIGDARLFPWAFGTAICSRVKGVRINHTVNICRTYDKGYVFVEPQDFSIWEVDTNLDVPYFVEMR